MIERETLIKRLKHCADNGTDCTDCPGWEHDCGSMHCVDELLLTAAKALEEQIATDNNDGHKWIPVTERLPENDEPYEEYLVNIMADHFPVSTWDDDPYCEEYVTVAQFDDKQMIWYLHGGNTALNALILPEDSRVNTESVTHWMPLPEPPKEVE